MFIFVMALAVCRSFISRMKFSRIDIVLSAAIDRLVSGVEGMCNVPSLPRNRMATLLCQLRSKLVLAKVIWKLPTASIELSSGVEERKRQLISRALKLLFQVWSGSRCIRVSREGWSALGLFGSSGRFSALQQKSETKAKNAHMRRFLSRMSRGFFMDWL